MFFVLFLFFVIILVEINMEGVSWEICKKKASIYGHNYRAEQLPKNERY